MPRDPEPLPEQAIGHMVFKCLGGPWAGKTCPVYFKHGDRPRVGKTFAFAVAEKAWKAMVKKEGKTRMAEYKITKLPEELEPGSMLLAGPGEMLFTRMYGVLEA